MIEEKIIETITVAFLQELNNECKGFLGDVYDEAVQFIGTDIKKYLEKQRTKYSHIKTLLKGNTPVYLYEIYYPISLRLDFESISTDKVNTLFSKSSFLTIIGDAGSGKSTLTKHLFLSCIQEKFGIPILLELRYLNDTNGDIKEYIISKIFENSLSVNKDILERMLKNGKFVFFLDGFDELNSDVKTKVIHSLNSFINQFEKNKYILTSRPYSNIENLPLFRNVFIKELDKEKGEIDGFINKQLQKEPELAEKIIQSLKDNESSYIESFLTNPLLLTLYILTFQTNAEIPNKKYIFYRRVINALFSEHDSKTKLGYVREKRSRLTQEDFEEILRAFCFLSYFEQKYDFDYDYIDTTLRKVKDKIKKHDFSNHDFIYDLKSAIALWTEDNGTYAFAHRSLQEYFAASFIKNLNSTENERAYHKIIERFSNSHRAWEVENFLSLCNEMDEINFTKYYKLPLLIELRGQISNQNRETLSKSFVAFFANGLYISEDLTNHPTRVNVNNDVYKAIYFHLPFTVRLYRSLEIIATEKIQLNDSRLTSIGDFPFKGLSLKPTIPDDILELILQSDIPDISADFDKYIDHEITKSERLISDAMSTDRDLLDMI